MRETKKWEDHEIEQLKLHGPIKGCAYVANKLNRTVRSVQHKYNELGLKKPKAQVGDIIRGWRILEIYIKDIGTQKCSFAKIKSVIDGYDKERECRLTDLTNHQIPFPDKKRLDLTKRNTTHGMSDSRLYRIWAGMLNRCNNSKQGSYKNYGGRGISVCEEWKTFENFMNWALSNGFEEELTIDRIDVNGNYCAENCKWSDKYEQIANRRNSNIVMHTAFGETKSTIEWTRDPRCVIYNHNCLIYRIEAGWDAEDVITKPSERKQRKPLKQWMEEKYPNIMEEFYLDRYQST